MQLAKLNIPFSNFIIKQDRYDKKFTNEKQSKDRKQQSEKIDHLAVRNNIYKQMKMVAPNCCLVMKAKPVRSKIDNKVPTLTEFANLYQVFITSKSPEDKISNFTKFINLNQTQIQTQIKTVYNSTVRQSKSQVWIAQIKGSNNCL